VKKYLQITIVLSLFFLIVFVKNIRGSDDEERRVILPTPTPTQELSPTPSQIESTIPVSSPPPPPNTPIPVRGKYKDGTYTGSMEDAIYGNYRVKAVISGGKLTDVILLDYPNDNRTSNSINTQAFPMLRDEALAAQSAQIDIITGASDSSPAFVRSLQTALNQAK